MGSEECLCTQPFPSRFHQCHGVPAALSCPAQQAGVSNWGGWHGRAAAGGAVPPVAGVTRDPQREKGSANSGQASRDFKCLQDLQDLDALSHWGDSKADLPWVIHIPLAVISETDEHRNSCFPHLDISCRDY